MPKGLTYLDLMPWIDPIRGMISGRAALIPKEYKTVNPADLQEMMNVFFENLAKMELPKNINTTRNQLIDAYRKFRTGQDQTTRDAVVANLEQLQDDFLDLDKVSTKGPAPKNDPTKKTIKISGVDDDPVKVGNAKPKTSKKITVEKPVEPEPLAQPQVIVKKPPAKPKTVPVSKPVEPSAPEVKAPEVKVVSKTSPRVSVVQNKPAFTGRKNLFESGPLKVFFHPSNTYIIDLNHPQEFVRFPARARTGPNRDPVLQLIDQYTEGLTKKGPNAKPDETFFKTVQEIFNKSTKTPVYLTQNERGELLVKQPAGGSTRWGTFPQNELFQGLSKQWIEALQKAGAPIKPFVSSGSPIKIKGQPVQVVSKSAPSPAPKAPATPKSPAPAPAAASEEVAALEKELIPLAKTGKPAGLPGWGKALGAAGGGAILLAILQKMMGDKTPPMDQQKAIAQMQAMEEQKKQTQSLRQTQMLVSILNTLAKTKNELAKGQGGGSNSPGAGGLDNTLQLMQMLG